VIEFSGIYSIFHRKFFEINITINRNGKNIMGDATNMTVAVDGAAFGLVYVNVTRGWVLIENL